MTEDDIIGMGHEADTYANCEWNPAAHPQYWKQYRDEYFAYLVASHEREACAKLCEEEVGVWPALGPRHCAEAIRARSQS